MISSNKYLRRKRLDPSNLSLLKVGDRIEIIIHPNYLSVGKIIFIDGNKKLLECDEPQFYLHCGEGLGKEERCYWLGIDDTIKDIIKEIKVHRSIADPNEGFIKCLKIYVKSLNEYD